MIELATTALILPDRPALVRAHDTSGIPSSWEMIERQKATFPFPVFCPRVSRVLQAIPQGTGTNIGDINESAGRDAAFNGTTSSLAVNCATKYLAAGGTGYLGKDYTTIGGAIMSSVTVYGSSDFGYLGTAGTATINLRGKITSPSSSSDGTLLATTSFSDVAGTNSKTLNSSDTTTVYFYVWVELTSAISDTLVFAEIEFTGWI